MNDGGVVALVGFFYQLVGSTAVLASAQDAHAVLQLEPSGEDALVRSAKGDHLMQFKYSGVKKTIKPAELAEILTKLKKHSKDAKVQWELITNRSLSPASRALMDGDKNSPVRRKVDNENLKVIETLGGRLAKVAPRGFTEFEHELQHYGRRFGLMDSEIAVGANRVVGALLRTIRDRGSGAAVDLAFLNSELVGFGNPGVLTGFGRADELAEHLAKIAAGLGGPALDDVIPRNALKDLCVGDHPVVIVEGPGGCGKTISVLWTIHRHISAQARLGMTLQSSQARTFMSVVADWRSPTEYQTHIENLDISIQRLLIANDGAEGWIIFVALDGLDESEWQKDARLGHAIMLIRCSLEMSGQAKDSRRLKVIVTCRNRREVLDLLSGDGVGGLDERADAHVISLGEFEESEFRALWSKWLASVPMPAWSLHGESQVTIAAELLYNSQQTATAVDMRLIAALRNPAVMGCFRTLSEEIQRRILDGDEPAWQSLLERYLKWFTEKAFWRRSMPAEVAAAMLSAAARATRNNSSSHYDYEKFWVAPASHRTGKSELDARQLFRDAVTCGIVDTPYGQYKMPDRTPIKWQWRHVFFAEYLCSLA